MPKEIMDVEVDMAVYYRFFAFIKPMALATGSGAGARFLTWQLEEAYYHKRQVGNAEPYSRIYCLIFSNLRRSFQSFKSAGIGQTIGKSFANMGTVAVVEKKYSHESSTKQGIRIAFGCPIIETPATVRDEYRKVLIFLNRNLDPKTVPKSVIWTKEFGRVFGSTYVRLLGASILSFGGTYALADYLRPLFPEQYQKGQMPKIVASGICGFGMQPAIMPFINWQTEVMENPGQKLSITTKKFIKKPKKEICRGLIGRMFCQGVRYPLQFGMMAGLNWAFSDEKEAVPEVTPQKRAVLK